MKRNPLKIFPIIILGGLLGLTVLVGTENVISVKAEDTVNYVEFTSFADKGASNGGIGESISFTSNNVTVSTNGGYSTNGVLRVYGNKGKKLTITSKNYKIGSLEFTLDSSYSDATLAAGIENVNDMTWSYTPKAQTRIKYIKVNFAVEDITLSSISADTNKLESFTVGNALDLSSVKIHALASDNKTYDVSDKCTFDPADGTILTNVGSTTVNVTYASTNKPATTSGNDLTTSFNVVVTQGEKPTVYTKVTDNDDLVVGDKVLFVAESANKAAKGTLTSSDTAYKHYLDTDNVSVADSKISLTSESSVSEYEVVSGSIANTFAFKNANGKYLSTYSIDRDGLKFVDEIDAASSWTVDVETTGLNIKSNISGQNYDSNVYLKYNVNTFRAYKASSAVTETSIYKYSSGAEKIKVQSTASVIEDSSISIASTAEGFTPTSYIWTVDDVETLEIVGNSTSSSVQVKGLKPGSANLTVKADNNDDLVATCVVTVIAKKDAVIENGEYFISDYAGSHVMAHDLSDNENPDYSDSALMWTIENTGVDGDAYSISNGSQYLIHNPNKKASSLDLVNETTSYWIATKVETGVYTFEYSETGNELSCKPEASTGTWFAYDHPEGTQNLIKLFKVGNYTGFEIEKYPTTKQYVVGDDLKTTNLKVNALYDNGAKVDITDKIEWQKLSEGTKAYGTITLGGESRTIEVDTLKIYKGDVSTFVIDGLGDTFAPNEKINKDNYSASITYKLENEEDLPKTLNKNEYTITPEVVTEDTEYLTISLVKDPTVTYQKPITVKESTYVATPYIADGDTIVIGTLGYDPFNLTGGYELTGNGTNTNNTIFGYLPNGQLPLTVAKVGSLYTLKDENTGLYLKGDSSTIGYYAPDMKSIYDSGDGHYEFNLNVTIGGSTELVTMETTTQPDFTYSNVFSSFTYVGGGYTDYITGISDLANKELTFELWSSKNNYESAYDTATVKLATWSFENNVFSYALETSSELPAECYFVMSYDEDFEEWVISSNAHQDKQLYLNTQTGGNPKFGFYTKGSSYLPVMVFRDNTKPLSSEVTKVSVSFNEGMNEVAVGEEFPWTSALIVTVTYSNGAHKVLPVGGYTITQMPDTSVIGQATGKIAYGQIGNQIEKEFTITVKGHTQAFDVVCKDPILVGETYQAHLEDNYQPPEGEPITWSVSDPTLASIDQEGNVTGLKPGYVDVIATSFDGTYSDYEHIRIYQQVESVTLDQHEITLNAGEKATLNATVLPEDASNKTVEYSSSDNNTVYVNPKTGEITAVKEGTATITCAAQNHPEENYDTCVVTVNPASVVHVTNITLNTDYKELEPKQTFNLVATIEPSNATIKDVIWSVDHENIAKVDNNGKVTAVAKGECTITVTTADGALTAKCTIKVKANVEPVYPTSVTLNQTSLTLDGDKGESFKLIATVAPGDASTKLTWSTDNNSVATVNYDGTVTAVGKGTCVITVATDNGKTASCTVKVTSSFVIDVEDIELSETSIELKVGEKFTLDATVSPDNADDQEVKWSSSNKDIAEVSSSGVVTAIGPGECIITATCGGIAVECEVTVEDEEKTTINVDGGTIAAVAGGTAAVGVGLGCGIGIPVRVHKKHKKLIK